MRIWIPLLSLILITGIHLPSFAQDLNSASKALKLISDFSAAMCGNPPLSGNSSSVELTGSGKAELAKLVKQLADLKVEGTARYTNAEYQGLLQKDLASALKDSSSCKVKVFESLNDKLIPKPKA